MTIRDHCLDATCLDVCLCARSLGYRRASMHKELIIATTSQESKLAILEDDELVEYYIERRRSQGIVGNIYKGKVTKVLPGMQSAFVDIGLERDAFLYVSDFLEDTDEYEKIVATVEAEVASLQDTPSGRRLLAAPAIPSAPLSFRAEVASRGRRPTTVAPADVVRSRLKRLPHPEEMQLTARTEGSTGAVSGGPPPRPAWRRSRDRDRRSRSRRWRQETKDSIL